MARSKLEQFLSSKHGLLLLGFVVGVGVTLIGIQGYQKATHSQMRLPAQAAEAVDVDTLAVHIANLDSSNEFVRSAAAEALGLIGPPAIEAVPKLIKLLKDKATWVPADAARALGDIGSAEAISALIEASNHPNGWVQAAATKALGLIRPTTVEVVHALANAWLDDDAWVRSYAADALMAMGPGIATEAAPTLIQFLQGPRRTWDWPQDVACKVLGKIGTEATVIELQKIVNTTRDGTLKYSAQKVIAAITARTGV